MAKMQRADGKKRRSRFLYVKTMGSMTIVVACIVLVIGGIQGEVRTSKIVYHCLGVSGVIGLAFGAVIKVMASYEEMNSGKA